MTSTCGVYGSLLGGAGVLGDGGYLSKTYTNLCKHNMIRLDFALVAIDGWDGETIALFVDNIEVTLCVYSNIEVTVLVQEPIQR